ncbi:M23 family metallopeptidase [Pseudoclavibacter sp. 8L]|uniref:M23 family metallopeptidase n=1 Tax=Pseudoclavibacter sp. 8L TaxID=2653162 RepID=UPI0012F39ACD|nr:M23 family metallopeptidase [Pseudoclavibacter sp. 8L]VXB74779.1 conserved hypothetical protein [Pseudoclavibacter sp. 8L]
MTNHDMGVLNSKIEKLAREFREYRLSNSLNRGAVDRGALEIISPQGLIVRNGAGILLIGNMDATGRIDVTGALNLKDGSVFTLNGTGNVTGLFNLLDGSTLTVDGFLRGKGDLEWEGPAKFKGLSIFDGDVAVTKSLDVTADSRFRARVRIEDDLELINNGKFKAGAIEIDPANHNGSVRWGFGQQILAESGGLELYSAGSYGLQIKTDGVYIPLMERITESGQLADLDFIAFRRPSGKLVRVSQDAGSPLGGDLEWPFDPETNTDEFGPRIHPITGELRNHNGMDFAPGEGTDIRVAARGTVIERGTNPGAGFGYYLTVQHNQTTATLGAHMLEPSPFQMGDVVPKGAIIGRVGNTGTSTGAHYHFEVHINGTPENPRSHITKPYQP